MLVRLLYASRAAKALTPEVIESIRAERAAQAAVKKPRGRKAKGAA